MLWNGWRELFKGVRVHGPEDVGERLVTFLGRLDQEAVVALAVGPDGSVRACRLVALGPCSGAPAEPRDLFRDAVRAGAVGLIIAHNHPSRVSVPTQADLAFTTRVLAAGALLGIEILDHVLVAGRTWRSLRESTRLWDEVGLDVVRTL